MIFGTKVINWMEQISERLTIIEERLLSDRRAVPVLKETIERLEKQNEGLLDRLMARDFEQLQTFKIDYPSAKDTYDIQSDESFAGEVLDLKD